MISTTTLMTPWLSAVGLTAIANPAQKAQKAVSNTARTE